MTNIRRRIVMSRILFVGLLVLFSVHFISEVFVENKKAKKLLNNLAFVGLALWFLVTIVRVAVFGA